MKNKGFKEEEKHLVEVQSKFDAKIQSEKQRLTEEHLDQQRQDFIDFSIHQLEEQKESPYFGRIDVQFEGEPEVEKCILVHLHFLMKKSKCKFMIGERRLRVYFMKELWEI